MTRRRIVWWNRHGKDRPSMYEILAYFVVMVLLVGAIVALIILALNAPLGG